MNFHERKKDRSDYYFNYVYKYKERICSACNGSGYYDSDNSPKCSSCLGTGKERYRTK